MFGMLVIATVLSAVVISICVWLLLKLFPPQKNK